MSKKVSLHKAKFQPVAEVQKQLGVDILLCVFVFISIKSTYKMPGVVPNSSHISVPDKDTNKQLHY